MCTHRRLNSLISLIMNSARTVFTVFFMGCSGLKSLCGQRRLWSDWANTQADLSLRWVPRPFSCWFYLLLSHMAMSGEAEIVTADKSVISINCIICFNTCTWWISTNPCCENVNNRLCAKSNKGAQWLSGRVLDSRPKGRVFEPHWRHCLVSLSKTH